MHEGRPGPWLRLTTLGASAATLLAVVSGAAHLGTAHRVLAALALPPLCGIAVAAWTLHPRLRLPSLAALVTLALLSSEGFDVHSGGKSEPLAVG